MAHSFVPYALAFREPIATGAGAWTRRLGAWLRVEREDGRVLHGEVAPPDPALTPEGLAAAIESGPCRDAAFDLAALDGEAQRFGRPLAFLLADRPRERVKVNALLFAREAGALADEAARVAAAGFGTVKIKVGAAPPDEDVARVRAVRERVGPAVAIRLDANGAWDGETALRVLGAVEPLGIEYVEDPVRGDLRAVGLGCNVPVAFDAPTLEAGRAVLHARGADVLVLKPMALGGPTATRRLAVDAIEAGLGVVITSVMDSPVGVAGALHLAASLPGEERAHGLATVALLEEAPVEGLAAPQGGFLSLPAGPGLGVRLRERAP